MEEKKRYVAIHCINTINFQIQKIVRALIHRRIYLIGLCLIAFFLSISEYLVNATIIIIIINYLIELNYKSKIQSIIHNKSLLLFLLLITIPILWVLNSTNISFALSDIKIKLPLLALPVIISSSKKLNLKEFKIIIYIFIFGLLISSTAGLLSYFNIYFKADSNNARTFSLFISHIRMSLMLCLAIFSIIYFIYNKIIINKLHIILTLCISIWFLIYMILIQSFTGLIIFILLTLSLLTYCFKNAKGFKVKAISLFSLISIPLLLSLYIGYQIKHFYITDTPDINTYSDTTSSGNLYYHYNNCDFIENGNLIYANICNSELIDSWNKISDKKLDENKYKDQSLWHCLLRYMSSKGLRKDTEGISQLTSEDIKFIEQGETNYKYAKNNTLTKRIYTSIWQIDVYLKGGNPSGHSLSQRIEYLKYGVLLFSQNFWTGTGTGDLDDEYKSIYTKNGTMLEKQYRHRSHNQYLTFFISFGIFGGLLCMLGWFAPLFINKGYKNYTFLIFFIIASISMLTDDTLETNTGVVFVSYFYSLLLWGKDKNIKTNKDE